MNKGDLINEVAQIVSTKKQAQEVVDGVFFRYHRSTEKK
jgi:nucleoid DNA-binding protein